jgi:hypothetical protein
MSAVTGYCFNIVYGVVTIYANKNIKSYVYWTMRRCDS